VDVITFLLSAVPHAVALESPQACFDMLEALDDSCWEGRRSRPFPTDRAAMGGFHADRLGYAFLAGYRAALISIENRGAQRSDSRRSLSGAWGAEPPISIDASLSRASLCATEEGGAHPRAIQTKLVSVSPGWRLDGKKTFATLASVAETLLVVASVSREGDRNHLRVVRIPARRDGIAMRVLPALPFAPEIPHAEVTFEDVHVEPTELIEGDGYADVLKPFRTIEDIHVTVAWLAYVVRLARDKNRDVAERAIASIVALRGLSDRDPSAPATHVALAGVLTHAAALAESWDLEGCDEPTRERWRRDRPLLAVAGTVRKLRREAAWGQMLPIQGSNKPPAA
jgi:hypothetical protein